MKPGINCSKTYNPLKTKSCSKCVSTLHHEFDCQTYIQIAEYECENCSSGLHFKNQCKKSPIFPPVSQFHIQSHDIEKLTNKIDELLKQKN